LAWHFEEVAEVGAEGAGDVDEIAWRRRSEGDGGVEEWGEELRAARRALVALRPANASSPRKTRPRPMLSSDILLGVSCGLSRELCGSIEDRGSIRGLEHAC